MKKKNELSIFKLDTSWRWYIRKPWQFFKDIYYMFRDLIRRGRYGFAPRDVWSMDDYLLYLLPEMLRYLGEHSHGYPGAEPFETFEKYQAWLFELADKFEKWRGDLLEKNEYYEEYIEQRADSEEHEDLKRKFFERITELEKEKTEKLIKAYTELAKNHCILWD